MFSRIYWKLSKIIGKCIGIKWPYFISNVVLDEYLEENSSVRRALLYYKTEPFVMPWRIKGYTHTNLWEIVEIVKMLNRYGFSVDIVDRDENDFVPADDYQLFIGLGAGHSGKHFSKYASKLKSAIKVLIAAGPEPTLSNRLVTEQYSRFNDRKGSNIPAMRLTQGIDFDAFLRDTDYLLVIGELHTFCPQSYIKLGKPVLNFLPSTSPSIRFLSEWFNTRSMNSFLCFAGDGFICKGVDIVVDAFSRMPDAEVFLCGPDSEPAFFEVLGKDINNLDNIHYEGFIRVGGKRFEELASRCSHVVFPSSAEGCATSVATALRAGLLPVVTHETGIDISAYGFYIEGDKTSLVQDTINACRIAMLMSADEYQSRVWRCLEESNKYTQCSFTNTFDNALRNIIEDACV